MKAISVNVTKKSTICEFVTLDGDSLTIDRLIKVVRCMAPVCLAEDAKTRMRASRRLIEEKVASNQAVYGVTTGFGDFSKVKISSEKLLKLQVNLIRSHAVGVGEFAADEIVRATMLLRINALAKGCSGVRVELVETLIDMLNKNVLPHIPCQGSVGASGDLAPLSHIALGLIGEGEVSYNGKIKNATTAMKQAGIIPATLEMKEGLALINGVQFMTAIGALACFDAYKLAKHADIAGAMSTDAMKGTVSSADKRIQKVRAFKGQGDSAKNIRNLLEGSEILASHTNCDMIQDSYSIRCIPQVHGASRDTIDYVKGIIEIEMNSATDNPLIFANDGDILSGGNFHGQPVALAMDFLGIALAELANISERRIAKLVDKSLSNGLPPFLTGKGGLNSGFMIVQYTAASLVSENKTLAHPASVDSIPTSASQEDHVSMGTIGARHCRKILKNAQQVIGIELLCAAQGVDFRRPLKSSSPIERAHAIIRKNIPKLVTDRIIYTDLVKIKELVENNNILEAVEYIIKLC